MSEIHSNVCRNEGNGEQDRADQNGGVDKLEGLKADTVIKYTCEIHINV